MLGVRAMVEDVREGVMVAFMEAWKDSCLEGDNFWKAVSMLDILIVVVVGMGVLGLDEGQEMVGTCVERQDFARLKLLMSSKGECK